MIAFSSKIIQDATQGAFYGKDIFDIAGVAVDSRQIKHGFCFFALFGKKCDGHDFIINVIEAGASGIVINEGSVEKYHKLSPEIKSTIFCVVVPDTSKALLQVAKYWRNLFTIPVVGITGTVGKTTTKELINNFLKDTVHNPLVTEKSMNGLIGLPLTLLRLRSYHTIAICEVGISETEEMDILVDILRPTVAVVTYIGSGHLAGLSCVENVFAEKIKLFKYLQSDQVGIINGDQEIFNTKKYNHRLIRFGFKKGCMIRATIDSYTLKGVDLTISLFDVLYKIHIQTFHRGLISNILAAIAVVKLFNISDEFIFKKLESLPQIHGRFKTISLNNNYAYLVDDSYNANPESMREGILAFNSIPWPRKKIVILGDMFELGDETEKRHSEIADLIKYTSTIAMVISVGSFSKAIHLNLPLHIASHHVQSWQEAVPFAEKGVADGAAIMIKGSRSMNLDKLVDHLLYTYQVDLL